VNGLGNRGNPSLADAAVGGSFDIGGTTEPIHF
jgi:hypothetical protein